MKKTYKIEVDCANWGMLSDKYGLFSFVGLFWRRKRILQENGRYDILDTGKQR